MFEAEADPARNLLLMTFREHIGPAELAQGLVQVAVAVAPERLSACCGCMESSFFRRSPLMSFR